MVVAIRHVVAASKELRAAARKAAGAVRRAAERAGRALLQLGPALKGEWGLRGPKRDRESSRANAMSGSWRFGLMQLDGRGQGRDGEGGFGVG